MSITKGLNYDGVIKELKSRIGYGYTQRDLAIDLGVADSYISEVFSGKKRLSLDIIQEAGFTVSFFKKKKK